MEASLIEKGLDLDKKVFHNLHTSDQIGASARGETGTAAVPSAVVKAIESTSSTTSPASCTTTLLKSIPGGITCSASN
jgi:hypothetical protein